MASVSDTSSYNTQLQRQKDSFESERSQTRENHDRQVDKLREENEEKLASTKKEYQERLEKTRTEANEDVRKLKEDVYDRRGKKVVDDSIDVGQVKNDYSRYREELEKETKSKIRNTEEFADKRSAREASAHTENLNDAIRSARKSQTEEGLNHLKQREYIEDNYTQQKNKILDQEAALEHHFSRELGEGVEGANERANAMMTKQKEEFRKTESQNRADATRLQSYYEKRLRDGQNKNEQSTAALTQNSERALNQVVQQRDSTYQDYLGESKIRNDQELARRDEELHTLKTTSDPMKVAPAVVEKIRNDSESRHYALLQEEQKTNQKNLDAVRARSFADQAELKDDFTQKTIQTSRVQQSGADLTNKQFSAAYTALQEKEQRGQDELKQTQRERVERMSSQHSLESDVQQRRFREDLDAQRDVLVGNARQIQDELEQKQRLQAQELTGKVSDVRRDYERKMADEQDLHSKTVTDLKYDYDKKLRDQARQSTRAMDERVKAYEYQIKQQEVAFKEKERFLTELYQEELDKVKRSNARLIQKKS